MQGAGGRGRSGAEENAALTLLAGGALAVFAFAGAGAGAGATCKEEKQVRMVPGHPTSEGVPGACVRVPDHQRAQLHSQLSEKRRTVEKRAPAALRTVVPWNPGVRKSRTPSSPSPAPPRPRPNYRWRRSSWGPWRAEGWLESEDGGEAGGWNLQEALEFAGGAVS